MLQHQMLASYQHIVILLQLQSSDTVISSYLFSTGRSWMMCWEIPPPWYLVVLFCLDSLVLDESRGAKWRAEAPAVLRQAAIDVGSSCKKLL